MRKSSSYNSRSFPVQPGSVGLLRFAKEEPGVYRPITRGADTPRFRPATPGPGHAPDPVVAAPADRRPLQANACPPPATLGERRADGACVYKASNAQAEDLFGTSTAVSGDTVVVGAPYEDGSGPMPNENATNAGAAYVFLSDDIAPSVTVEQAAGQPDPASAGPILFTATFSEPINPSTFTATDVALGGTAGGTLSASLTPVNATTFTIAVSGMRSAGTVTASIPAGAVTDPLGNPNLASTSADNSVTFEYRVLLPLIVR